MLLETHQLSNERILLKGINSTFVKKSPNAVKKLFAIIS